MLVLLFANMNQRIGLLLWLPWPTALKRDSVQTLAMFILITAHALFHLMCHWLVWFEAAALYVPASNVEKGTYVQVDPKPHRGASAIVEVCFCIFFPL